MVSGVSVNSIDKPARVGKVGVLKTSSISKGRFFPFENKEILDTDIKRAKLNPAKETILISRMNTPKLVGEIGYVEQNHPQLFLPDRLWMATTVASVNSKWLAYVLVTDKYNSKILNLATGTSNSMKNISKEQFLSLNTFVPDIKEQNKVASFLTILDRKIEKQQEKVEKLEQFKKGMMQKIFSQELRFKDEDGNTYPNFAFGKIRDYLIHLGSGVTPRGGRDVYTDSGVLFIRSQNVYNTGLVLNDIARISEEVHKKMKNSKVFSNDVLLNITGASIGRTALVPKNFPEGNVNQHVCIIRTKPNLYPAFLKFYLESSIGQKLIFQDQAGQTREALNLAQIKAFNVFIPSLKEQVKISDCFSKIEMKIEKEKEKLMVLDEQKKGFMQGVFV